MSYLMLGAAEWGWNQYEALAISTAEQSTGSFFVVQVGHNGSSARAQVYPSWSAASDAWDAMESLPANVGFAILYNKTRAAGERVVEQKVNPLVETITERKIDWKSVVPWIVGGTAVIATSLFIARGPKRRRRGRGRT